ncbi:MAG: MFS transporter [Actinomycetota bacterium]|nr:MFS transporter [Actinomycetota bacterium]
MIARVRAALVPPWADRNLRVVLAARAAMSVARAVASVVTALYLAAIGFTGIEIGVLFVAVTVAAALMSTTVGVLADRWGRKPFLVAVPLLACAAGVAFAEVRATSVLFVAASLGSFGRGSGAGAGSVGPYQPAESALVADGVDGARRSAAFGRLAFASTLGALVGGLLAEVVRTTPHMRASAATAAYRPAFLLAAALAAVAGLLALLVREPPRPRTRDGGVRWQWPRRSWPALWRFWVTNATNGAAVGLFGPFVSYWLYRRYGATPAVVGELFAVVNVGSLASPLAASRIAGRLGTVRAIGIVRALGGVLLVPMVLAPTISVAGAVYFVRMVLQRVGLPLRQSFTQDMADPEERATVAALSNLPAQVTQAGSQALAGYLFDEVSLSAPFEIAAVLQVANAALYPLLFSLRPPRPVDGPQQRGAHATGTAAPALDAELEQP